MVWHKFKLVLILFLFSYGCSTIRDGVEIESIDTDIEKKLINPKENSNVNIEKFEIKKITPKKVISKRKQKQNAEKTKKVEKKVKVEKKTKPKKVAKKEVKETPKPEAAKKEEPAKIENKPLTEEEKRIKKLREQYEGYDKISEKVWEKFFPKFFVGESHRFEVKYLGIKAGYIHINTDSLVEVAGKPSVHFKVNLKSASYYSMVYELNDTLESIVDLESFRPVKYKLVQRESSQDVDDLQLFDHDKRKTYFWYRRFKKGKEKKDYKENIIPTYLQDSFSSLMFVRGLPLKLGDKYQFPVATRAKLWIIKLEVVDENDSIVYKKKDVPAIRVKAETHFPGVLKKRGDIVFWYSKDDTRKLLKFQAKIKIGSIEGQLFDYMEGKK